MNHNIKLSTYGQPYWTGTWTANLRGDYCGPKDHNSARSYFMRSNDRDRSSNRAAPWIRRTTQGWDVIVNSTVVDSLRLKDEAQRAAERLAGIRN
jgi:hypothetical protein